MPNLDTVSISFQGMTVMFCAKGFKSMSGWISAMPSDRGPA